MSNKVVLPWQGSKAWGGQKILIVHADHFDAEIAELQSKQEDLSIELRIIWAELPEEIAPACEQCGATVVALENPQLLSPETRDALRRQGIQCVSLVDLYESLTGKVPLATIVPENPISWTVPNNADLLRRILNLLLAGAGFLLALPLYPLIAIAIWTEDRGSILFVQERLGKNRKPFQLIKFRTMGPLAEKTVETNWMFTELPKGEVERLTAVGKWLRKFRLDEFPQLINVIKGDMNAVGPRAETRQAFEARCELLAGYENRLKVKPGMAGWGLIHSYSDAREKLQYDLFYIKHRSFRFDLFILLETTRRILVGRVR